MDRFRNDNRDSPQGVGAPSLRYRRVVALSLLMRVWRVWPSGQARIIGVAAFAGATHSVANANGSQLTERTTGLGIA